MAEGNGNLLLISADGANITFTRTGDNTYQAPTGIYLEIKQVSGGYEIKDKDQTVTFYKSEMHKVVSSIQKINTEIRRHMSMMGNHVYQK